MEHLVYTVGYPKDLKYAITTDIPNMIVVKFTEHHFNDSQEVTALSNHPADVMTMARAMREIGDWLAINHKDIIL